MDDGQKSPVLRPDKPLTSATRLFRAHGFAALRSAFRLLLPCAGGRDDAFDPQEALGSGRQASGSSPSARRRYGNLRQSQRGPKPLGRQYLGLSWSDLL